jgi:hypothetical protein
MHSHLKSLTPRLRKINMLHKLTPINADLCKQCVAVFPNNSNGEWTVQRRVTSMYCIKYSYTAGDRQWPRNKRFRQQALFYGNKKSNKERCSLCGPCRNVTSRTHLETVAQLRVALAEARGQFGKRGERESQPMETGTRRLLKTEHWGV